jgi:hypothetical protein
MRPTLQQQLEEFTRKHATGTSESREQGDQHSQSPPIETRGMSTMEKIAAYVAQQAAASETSSKAV